MVLEKVMGRVEGMEKKEPEEENAEKKDESLLLFWFQDFHVLRRFNAREASALTIMHGVKGCQEEEEGTEEKKA